MSDESIVITTPDGDKQVISKKAAACAVNLGVRIIKEMIGDSISKVNTDQDIAELVATAILAELNI
jgi:hypothetical protein